MSPLGCRTNWATARVLQENGCDVVVPREQGCCGAIHLHAGASEPARAFADQNLAAFDYEGVDAVIAQLAYQLGVDVENLTPPGA